MANSRSGSCKYDFRLQKSDHFVCVFFFFLNSAAETNVLVKLVLIICDLPSKGGTEVFFFLSFHERGADFWTKCGRSDLTISAH